VNLLAGQFDDLLQRLFEIHRFHLSVRRHIRRSCERTPLAGAAYPTLTAGALPVAEEAAAPASSSAWLLVATSDWAATRRSRPAFALPRASEADVCACLTALAPHYRREDPLARQRVVAGLVDGLNLGCCESGGEHSLVLGVGELGSPWECMQTANACRCSVPESRALAVWPGQPQA
jgi:hypothetical protein